ncbi:MAG: SMP-30/gluconolactonase/LRE family protein [Burkholderiales bacterium]|jgi:sugar lactone lactonase YvrE|nr:SMP-30/gluconolactonase/LRE family protein [Burkholderiales bacterium]
MLRRFVWAIALVLVAGIAYFVFAPVPVEPVVWQAPQAPGYVGPHAPNTKLAGLRQLSIGSEEGPEHVLIGPDGKLYAAVASGAILRMNPDGSGLEKWVNTGGRVLGFDFDARGRLIAADAMRGLLAIGPDGKIEVLADKVGDDPIRYADAVVVAKNGKIYFTDASRRFGPKDWGGTFNASVLDILEHSATGRVLEFDPATGATRTVMRDLCFANGLALSADEKSLFVAETGEYRVWKVDPSASDASAKASVAGTPQARVILANLPGYPDNLMRGMDGRIWLGFTKPRGAAVDKMAGTPFLRKVTYRLPKSLWPVPPAYGHVFAFDEDGRVVADLQDPAGAYPETTGVTETADRLYIQSLHAPSLGWMAKSDAGWSPAK